MAAAGLGRYLLSGVRLAKRFAPPAGRGATLRCGPRLHSRYSVALAARTYSTDGGSDFKFAKSHEWVKMEGNTATVGISGYAQEKLGEVVFVELPEMGSDLEKGDQLSVLESVKAVAEVYTSLSGKVIEVNEELEKNPNLINNDPFGEGWLAKLETTNVEEELNDLMTQEQYNQHLSESI